MSQYAVLKCDNCCREVREEWAINWIRIELTGVVVTDMADKGISGEYCSKKCAIEKLGGGAHSDNISN